MALRPFVARPARLVLSATIAALALAALPASAGAGAQQISGIGQLPLPAGCISDGGADGCTAGVGLAGAADPVVSRDGRNVYVADSQGVTALVRGSNGALTFLANTPIAGGATDVHGRPNGATVYAAAPASGVWVLARDGNGILSVLGSATLAGVTDIFVSFDGLNLYAASPGGTTAYTIAADGSLIFLASYPAGLAPTNVVVSPDGRNVYVATAGGIDEYTRAADGTLTLLGSVTAGLANVDLEVTFDGANVYAATSAGIDAYTRAADGSLGFLGLFGSAGYVGVDSSPDGANVYAVGNDGLTAFDRGAGGVLSEAGCVNESGVGCAKGFGLSGASGLMVSFDGANVYVASTSGAVAVFLRVSFTLPGQPFCDPLYQPCQPPPPPPVPPPPLAPQQQEDSGPATGHNRMPDLVAVRMTAQWSGGVVHAALRVHLTHPGRFSGPFQVRFRVAGHGTKTVVARARHRANFTVRASIPASADAIGRQVVARIDPGHRLFEARRNNNAAHGRIA